MIKKKDCKGIHRYLLVSLPLMCLLLSACSDGSSAIQQAEDAVSARDYDTAARYASQARLSEEHHNAQIILSYVQYGDHMLAAAFWENDPQALRYLAGIVHDINGHDPRFNTTVLVLASAWGYTDLVKILLEAGADPNHSADKDGYTALMWSAKNFDEQLDMAQALLEAGSDVHASNHYAETALQIAQEYDNPNIARLLREYGAQD